MSNKALVLKELHNLMETEDSNNCFGVNYWEDDENDPFHWEITLVAPKGSLYEDGYFRLEAKIPIDYPNSPPLIKFLTKIYHCNIGINNGDICLSTLNEWNSNYNMEDVLNHLTVLLHKQNPNSPMNEFMRDEYNKNKSQFISNAKDWVKKYANITNFDDPSN